MSTQVTETDLSIGEKRRYIRKNIHLLSKQDKIEIGEIFIKCGFLESIKEGSDGCRINLKDISDHVISQVYGAVHHKINKPQTS